MPTVIKLPRRTLLVLSGAAGCGKSTFAAHRFLPTAVVSSDFCRALICDDANNQQVSSDAFTLLYTIIHKRLFYGRFTVVDSTALGAETRHRLLQEARSFGYLACLVIFNVGPDTCIIRDQGRARKVGEQVIRHQADLLQQALLAVPKEGWHQMHILDEQGIDDVVVEVAE